eukprot:SAG11_NODE_126_length_15729_cov_9.966859_18_plen_91_part_00
MIQYLPLRRCTRTAVLSGTYVPGNITTFPYGTTILNLVWHDHLRMKLAESTKLSRWESLLKHPDQPLHSRKFRRIDWLPHFFATEKAILG